MTNRVQVSKGKDTAVENTEAAHVTPLTQEANLGTRAVRGNAVNVWGRKRGYAENRDPSREKEEK